MGGAASVSRPDPAVSTHMPDDATRSDEAGGVVRTIASLPGNDYCADCLARLPAGAEWASVSFGALLCIECAGLHRALGVHCSFVRSLTMDAWSEDQLRRMQLGGNAALRRAFEAAGMPALFLQLPPAVGAGAGGVGDGGGGDAVSANVPGAPMRRVPSARTSPSASTVPRRHCATARGWTRQTRRPAPASSSREPCRRCLATSPGRCRVNGCACFVPPHEASALGAAAGPGRSTRAATDAVGRGSAPRTRVCIAAGAGARLFQYLSARLAGGGHGFWRRGCWRQRQRRPQQYRARAGGQ